MNTYENTIVGYVNLLLEVRLWNFRTAEGAYSKVVVRRLVCLCLWHPTKSVMQLVDWRNIRNLCLSLVPSYSAMKALLEGLPELPQGILDVKAASSLRSFLTAETFSSQPSKERRNRYSHKRRSECIYKPCNTSAPIGSRPMMRCACLKSRLMLIL